MLGCVEHVMRYLVGTGGYGRMDVSCGEVELLTNIVTLTGGSIVDKWDSSVCRLDQL